MRRTLVEIDEADGNRIFCESSVVVYAHFKTAYNLLETRTRDEVAQIVYEQVRSRIVTINAGRVRGYTAQVTKRYEFERSVYFAAILLGKSAGGKVELSALSF